MGQLFYVCNKNGDLAAFIKEICDTKFIHHIKLLILKNQPLYNRKPAAIGHNLKIVNLYNKVSLYNSEKSRKIRKDVESR